MDKHLRNQIIAKAVFFVIVFGAIVLGILFL